MEKKAVLLIDEYDVPLDKAFQYGYYDEMVSLIRNMFGKCFEDKFEPVFCSTYGMPENCEGKHFYRIKQFLMFFRLRVYSLMSSLDLQMMRSQKC